MHGATVLLYHPCAPHHERLLLSVLARSCLPDYIITSNPQLSEHMPIALVSWGHTLELSTVASSDICDWLETTASTGNEFDGVRQSRKYNLLLTWSAEQHRQQHAHPGRHSKMKESLKRCCEQTISSLLNGAMETELESNMKKESLKIITEEGKRRQKRAAIREKQEKAEDETTHQTNRTSISRTVDVKIYTSTLGPSADSPPGNKTLSDPPGPGEAPSQSNIQNTNQGLTPRPSTPLRSNMSKTTRRSYSLGFRAPESHKSRQTLQTAAQQPGPKHAEPRNPNPSVGLHVAPDGGNSERNDTARPKAVAFSSKQEGPDSAKHRDKDSVTHSLRVDVKERELEDKRTQSHTPPQHKSEKIGFVSKSQSPPQPNPQPSGYLSNSHECDGCKADEHCECNKESGASDAVVHKGLPMTPRTDEAVWAAAALGFLLILLTLSVLHTRLYRHWRTSPSLYWHDPQGDYDSVADVIRRRLRITNRRRKRGRRQECVLLPSSSSSDEHP
ncbi:uncharacterized protein tp53i13 isoform X2 [Cottoperca gobio]|uniref:Uncharacterized protein tp53i13 isoform X2 n=1 Tax=Cottoperca gobio TaxID=56716 RepID=A0A6J2QW19_COTGO|nr:tumor protein p53-inducible protein 13 isoform X2 [Cottoperca gobio]